MLIVTVRHRPSPRNFEYRPAGAATAEWLCHRQSVATSSAAQTSRMRDSLSRPMRSTSNATATDSTESRLTALRRGMGSSSGSKATSLASPRIVVVHGAISARRNRGIAASRDNTTTGRRPISGGSHHHTSPRLGRSVIARPRREMTQGHPTRRARQSGEPRTLRHTQHRSRPRDAAQGALPGLRRSVRRRWFPPVSCGRGRADLGPLWCSGVCESCHNHATNMPQRQRAISLSTCHGARPRRRSVRANLSRRNAVLCCCYGLGSRTDQHDWGPRAEPISPTSSTVFA